MKPLIVTNHGIEQYAARTGRNQFSCVAELINSIRGAKLVSFEDAKAYGINVTRKFKGDIYYAWYDPKVDDTLLAIVASDGAIKTVLRKEMYGYKPDIKMREKGRAFSYGYESPRKKSSRHVCGVHR